MMASWIMMRDISHLDYSEFIDAHARGEESWISQKTFDEVKRIKTNKVGHVTYELLKFDNGEMILVDFAGKPEKGVYRVQGIKIVPDELKDFFKQIVLLYLMNILYKMRRKTVRNLKKVEFATMPIE